MEIKQKLTIIDALIIICIFVIFIILFVAGSASIRSISNNKLCNKNSYKIVQLQKSVENLKRYKNSIVRNRESISDNQEQLLIIQSKVFKKEIQKATEILNKTKIPYYALISAEEGQVVFEGDNFGVEVVVKTNDEVITIR